jgi:sarcosine oxidase delta subunit
MIEAPPCPYCGARDVEQVSQFGSQIVTSQWKCRACWTYFEALRDEFVVAIGSLYVAPVETGRDRRHEPAADRRSQRHLR